MALDAAFLTKQQGIPFLSTLLSVINSPVLVHSPCTRKDFEALNQLWIEIPGTTDTFLKLKSK